jgi:hypothetical protein
LQPISREQCHTMFLKMDEDHSGHLNREEFEAVMMVLFGNVMVRVALQYILTLLLVPMIAQYLLNEYARLVEVIYCIIATLDEQHPLFNAIELTLEHTWKTAIDFWSPMIPVVVNRAFDKVQGFLSAVPDSVWNTIPVTLLSTVMTLTLVPWTLIKIDDFFQRIADRSNAAKAKVA